MAFIDDLARDPKSEEEFWQIIDETFEQVEGALTAHPAETREEALAGTLRYHSRAHGRARYERREHPRYFDRKTCLYALTNCSNKRLTSSGCSC
jgi:hypothetical protein